jgi:hypothetical protein
MDKNFEYLLKRSNIGYDNLHFIILNVKRFVDVVSEFHEIFIRYPNIKFEFKIEECNSIDDVIIFIEIMSSNNVFILDSINKDKGDYYYKVRYSLISFEDEILSDKIFEELVESIKFRIRNYKIDKIWN